MKNLIQYTMTADYRKEWNEIDSVREIVQNCLDNRECRSDYFLSEAGKVEIFTEGFILPMSSLALGESVKGSDPIGGFGEGFKLALMVLERSGCNPVVHSGYNLFRPCFVEHDFIGRKTFAIEVTETDLFFDGLKYNLELDESLINELKEKVNLFSDNVLPLPNDVDILEEYPGVVMVNGLFVCKEARFKFGYNFSPSKISLGCDRQIASSFGMAWETSRLWVEKLNEDNADLVLNMITENALDVSDIQYHMTTAKAKMITMAFTARFGNVTIKPMGSSLSHGMNVCGALYSTMKTSGYLEIANPFEESNTPYSKIKKLMGENKKHMRSKAYKAMVKLLDESKNWK